MRQSILAVSSFALVVVAGAAIADAAAQDVPVAYHTDPGPAHPRYVDSIVGESAVTTAAPTEAAAPYGRDPIYGITSRQSMTVQAGDTVYAIGRRYNLSPSDIIAANGLQAPYDLQIGQEIVLPFPQQAAPRQVAQRPAEQPLQKTVSYKETQRLDGIYTVKPGDTLYSLSRQFDVDLTTLAAANNMVTPYALTIDQRLIIPGSASSYTTPVPTPVKREITPKPAVEPILISRNPNSRFSWPLRGSIVMGYGVGGGGVRNDGINIAAPVGAPVRASADGEVVYTGSELEGYGNLLLIRHNDDWVSAYAHTDSILVKKGDRVQQGQVVAKVGRTGSVDQSQLHFELRHQLKPQDPIAALNGTHVNASVKTVR